MQIEVAINMTAAYSATLSALAAASERLRTARTVGEYIAARQDIADLRRVAARYTPILQPMRVIA